MGKHASGGRNFDKGLTALGQSLVITSETPPSGDPGDAAFDDPPFRQDGKAALGLMPRWLGVDQVLVASGAQTTHRLNVPPQMLFDPLKELSPVMTVTPNQGKPGKALLQWLNQLDATSQVRVISPRHFHFHQVALCVHEQVPFASPNFFSHVEAFLWPSDSAGFDRLTVNHSRTGLFVSPLLLPRLSAQGLEGPGGEVVIRGGGGWQVVRHRGPRAATAKQGEDAVDDFGWRVFDGECL